VTQKTAEEKSATKRAKIVIPSAPPIEEIYIDGIAGLMGRGGVVKLDCYRVDGFDKEAEAEVRRISHRLVLPATSLGELIKLIQGVAKSSAKIKEEKEA